MNKYKKVFIQMVFESLNAHQDSIQIEFIVNQLNEGKIDFSKIKGMIANLKDKKASFLNLIKKLNSTSNKAIRKSISLVLLAILLSTGGQKITPPQMNRISDIVVNQEKQISANAFKEIVIKNTKERLNKEIIEQISIGLNPSVIDSLNAINPNRFSQKYISRYDKYDDEIASGIQELRGIGEKPIPKLIKGLMMVETGMRPVKNALGYEGFPQTKQEELDWVNLKFGTNFTMNDLYDAKESAKFIHYYLKLLGNLKHVKDGSEALAAYNFGYGNLKKVKSGKIKYPKETTDYVKLISTIIKLA